MKSILATLCLFLLCSCAGNNKTTPAETTQKQEEGVGVIIPIYSQKVSLQLPNANWKPFSENKSDKMYRIEFSEKQPQMPNDDNWETLVSVQGFENMAHVPADKYLDAFADFFKKKCPNDFKYSPMGPVSISGHNAASAILGCLQMNKQPTQSVSNQKGELDYFFAIQGEKDLYLIHKAYRGKPSEVSQLLDKDFAKQFVADILPIKLCKSGGHEAECIE